jgi:hypothetical protein
MNVARKERQKKMKIHRTEKPREKYFKRVFISLNIDVFASKTSNSTMEIAAISKS